MQIERRIINSLTPEYAGNRGKRERLWEWSFSMFMSPSS